MKKESEYICGNTVAVVIRRYKLSLSATNQTYGSCPCKVMPQTVCYFPSVALKNKQPSVSDLAQELSMEIWISVTAQTEWKIIHKIPLYGRCPREKPYWLFSNKLQD